MSKTFDDLLLEGLTSPFEEWTPEMCQAMCHEAVASLQVEAKASGADQLTDEQLDAEIAAVRSNATPS